METFKNNTRKLYDECLSYVAHNFIGIKKKQLIKKISNFTDDVSFVQWVVRNANMRGKGHTALAMISVIQECLALEQTKRFYVSKCEEVNKEQSIDVLFENQDRISIETPENEDGVSLILTALKSSPAVEIDGVEYPYTISIHLYASPVLSKMVPLYGNYKNIMQYTEFAIVYMTSDMENRVITIPNSNEFVRKGSKLLTMPVKAGDIEMTVDALPPKVLTTRTEWQGALLTKIIVDTAMDTIKYLAYCHENKRSRSCKKADVQTHKVHTIQTDVSIDRLVPLHYSQTVYSPTSPATHKGGHHASPIEHDRKGYYRKSRGVGSYDLIGEEFVYVGERKGSYSYVRATHVNGNKKHAVYKV